MSAAATDKGAAGGAASAAGSLTVGTAGHIDHGKTALVRALTGRDTDRLAEEQRRGMSIELGYAELELGGRRLSLIDVPGHERFVRTMIAGASGIDLFLLVVAADDGVMPQTREHLAVLTALGVEAGVVALTKVDLVEEERRAAAAAEIAELLPGASVVAVSARSGEGIEVLRGRLGAVAEEVSARRVTPAEDEVPVLHVDRCFTIPGHGTVVTGTLWSGTLSRGDRVILLPAGTTARVRSIESHDRSHETIGPRRRVALNLAGLTRGDVTRGDVVTVPEARITPTYRLDVGIEPGTAAILGERRVQVHHGTRESPARVVDLGDGEVQLRLEQPLLARRGERVVVRRIAPPDTLGGAVVVDPAPRRHGPGSEDPEQPPDPREARVSGADPTPAPAPVPPAAPGPLAGRLLAELEADAERPRTPAKLAEDLGAERREVERALGELVEVGAAVRFKVDIVYPTAEGERLAAAATALAVRDGSTSIGEVRDELGLSRKYAQALLEHLDGERVLRRDGDRHYPRRAAAT
jgi:selenocysteine-specific elongation factor